MACPAARSDPPLGQGPPDCPRSRCGPFFVCRAIVIGCEAAEARCRPPNAVRRSSALVAHRLRRHTIGALVPSFCRLGRDVHFISGLMANGVPFLAAEMGPNVPGHKASKQASQRAETMFSQQNMGMAGQWLLDEAARLFPKAVQ
jgi:hypothetical protein